MKKGKVYRLRQDYYNDGKLDYSQWFKGMPFVWTLNEDDAYEFTDLKKAKIAQKAYEESIIEMWETKLVKEII